MFRREQSPDAPVLAAMIEAGPLIARCRQLGDDPRFQTTILAVIVANAALIGLETSPAMWERYGILFHFANAAVQVLFAAEIAVRLLAHAPRFHRFFRDGWNLFDFTIVAICLLPEAGPVASVTRLARLLRALRIVSALPELRLIVATMLRSIPSLGNVVVLLGLIVYVYAVLGVHLFGAIDASNWGSLPRAGLTLFEILTLEGWVELMDASLAATRWAWAYYVSFVVLAVFVVVNLFIAIVINNLEAAKREQEPRAAGSRDAFADRLARVREEVGHLEAELRGHRTLGAGGRAAPAEAIDAWGGALPGPRGEA